MCKVSEALEGTRRLSRDVQRLKTRVASLEIRKEEHYQEKCLFDKIWLRAVAHVKRRKH
jgi:hypothetical protein